jgi:Holliday junction resolvasome RuvABC DNA-binding subunit
MKTAFSRLVVSLLSLLTVVVALATSLLKFLTTLVGLATVPFERLTVRWRGRVEMPQKVSQEPAQESQRPNLRVVTSPSKRGELTFTLRGLGFKPSLVEKFVNSLSEKDLTQDIRDLIKQGLVALAPAALGGKS